MTESKKTKPKVKEESPVKKVTEKNKKEKIAKAINGKTILVAAIVVLLTFITTAGFLIYKNNESGFVKRVAQIIPYPAAIVDLRFASAFSYLDQLDIIKNYYQEFESADFNSDEGKEMLSDARKDVMNRIIEDAIIAKEAKRAKISISKDELEKEFSDLVTSSGGEEDFASTLKKYYGLTLDEFKQKIYKPTFLREKVAEAISGDEKIDAAAKSQADEIYEKATEEKIDFSKLAKEYSQDPGSAALGGDLGYFSKGKMVAEFEEVAFKLKKGEISKPVRTIYGYHIIKVTNIKGNEIQASHILVKVRDFNEWLEEKKTELEGKKYLGFIPALWQIIPTK